MDGAEKIGDDIKNGAEDMGEDAALDWSRTDRRPNE